MSLAAGCGGDDPDRYSAAAPTVAEAQALLQEAVQLAEAGDIDGLCELTIAEAGCTDTVTNVGPLPRGEAPAIVESRVIEQQSRGDGEVPASRIIGVCLGDRYTELMVLRVRSTGSAEFVNPVYWSGYSVSDVIIDDRGFAVGSLGETPEPDPC